VSAAATLGLRRLASYSEIAEEYYETIHHPTCASLRALSSAYLSPRLLTLARVENVMLEVGAGKSLLAPTWQTAGNDLRRVILLDSSPEMLAYSSCWEAAGARLMIGCANATGLLSGSVDVLVASLGDPYNEEGFWREVVRILRPGGHAIFTAPAHEWALRFRSDEQRDVAEFTRRDGSVLLMPSPVVTEIEQAGLFMAAGLELVDAASLALSDLSSTPAPKLTCMGDDEPVLRGYVVQRPR
jgi:SAM-dependent methyltransferase